MREIIGKSLSASDIGSAYYLGCSIKTEIKSAKRVMRKLKQLGMNKDDRKGAIRNVQS